MHRSVQFEASSLHLFPFPANKPFNFFDFSAAGSKTAPPESDSFVGDQTFKPGTPIKFGEAATEKKAAPTFQFQA
jgi:hypothetical protein